jgi:hypothetical protein
MIQHNMGKKSDTMRRTVERACIDVNQIPIKIDTAHEINIDVILSILLNIHGYNHNVTNRYKMSCIIETVDVCLRS